MIFAMPFFADPWNMVWFLTLPITIVLFFLTKYSPITIEGKRYLTVENYFQAMKAANPGDAEEIRLAPTPGKSKRLGRHCVIRKDWEDIKEYFEI